MNEARDLVTIGQFTMIFLSLVTHILSGRHMRWLLRGSVNPAAVLPSDCTDEEATRLIYQRAERYQRLIITSFLAWCAWALLTVVHLILSLLMRDWSNVVVDAVVLVIVWWLFVGRGGWRRWRARLLERVAVIKDRLRVVPVVAPGGAT